MKQQKKTVLEEATNFHVVTLYLETIIQEQKQVSKAFPISHTFKLRRRTKTNLIITKLACFKVQVQGSELYSNVNLNQSDTTNLKLIDEN